MYVPHVHCSIVYNSQGMETTIVSSMDEYIEKMWCIHTMEYYPAIKKDFVIRDIMDLEGICYVKQVRWKDKYHMILFICEI